jgi:site-specific DNA recombinase
MRAAKYRRISDDREGQELGVQRQDEDLDQHARRHGYEVVADYVDNDLGASGKAKRLRPAYRQMLEDARAGHFDVVLAYTSSRLTRRPREHEDLIDLAVDHGIRYGFVRSPSFDLNTADGRQVARTLAAADAGEAERTGERVERWHRAQAEKGAPPNAGTRPFGYDRHSEGRGPLVWTPHPVEAPVVAEMFGRIVAGESVTALRNDLNARGVVTSVGKPWTTTSLTRVLRSPTTAALRRLKDGTLKEGTWPPLVDRRTWERAQHTLDSRQRTGRRDSTRYLLSGGLAVCGRCGNALTGHRRHYRRYECRPAADGRSFDGCGVSIVADPVEDHVRDVVLAALDPALLGRLLADRRDTGQDSDVLARLGDLERELDALADDYADGRLTRHAYLKAADRLEARSRKLKASLSRDTAPDVLAGVDTDPETLRARWDAASVSWRRAFTETLLEAVEVAPARWRGGRLDLDRVSFRWRV